MPKPCANWAEKVLADDDLLIRIPKSLSWRDAAQLKINPPTAKKMLTDYVELKPGDWVIQNAANSAVGLHLIRFAKDLGVKTVNVVRREELVLQGSGTIGLGKATGESDPGELIRYRC